MPFCYDLLMDNKWKYAALGLGGLVIVQFWWWNRAAPQVLNLPRIPLLNP